MVGPHSRGCTPGWYVDAPLGLGYCPSVPQARFAGCLWKPQGIMAADVCTGANVPNHVPIQSGEIKLPRMPDQKFRIWEG
jgi:hypothetical protein